jgi:hypothetical protein
MTLTSTPHPGLDELDARRILAGEIADQLDILDREQESDRDRCAGTLFDSVETAIGDARDALTHLVAEYPVYAAAARDDLTVINHELERALDELAAGNCGHDCPDIPHDWVTADHLASNLIDRLADAGFELVRRPR